MYPNLLVLEASWDDGIHDQRTVRPFIEGWAAQSGITTAIRYYNARDDLRHWLDLFYSDPYTDTLYIAGHGKGTRLVGLKSQGINIGALLADIFVKNGRPRAVNPKGILVGACECFGEATQKHILSNTNSRLQWLAGYSVCLPWLESTLVDLAVLEYRFRGRAVPGGLLRGSSSSDQHEYCDVDGLAEWIWKDFPLSKGWGFTVVERAEALPRSATKWRRRRARRRSGKE